MSRLARRGKWIFLTFATLIAADQLVDLVLALSGGVAAVNWWKSVGRPLGVIVAVAYLWQGENWLRWLLGIGCVLIGGARLFAGIGLAVRLARVTPPEQADFFFQLFGGVFAIFAITGLLYLSAGLAFLFLPSVQAFFAHQRETESSRSSGSEDAPFVRRHPIGEVRVSSGRLMITDPMYLPDALLVENLPLGRIPILADVIYYPEGGERVAKAVLQIRPVGSDSPKLLTEIGVDSATIAVMDAETYEKHWKQVGNERIGYSSGASNEKVCKLIKERFGLEYEQIYPWKSMFLEPISESLEEQIVTYLKTFPEYAEHTFLHFSVKTLNSWDLLTEKLKADGNWTDLVLDPGSGANVVAFSSGFGDGCYPARGYFAGGELARIEIEFIGPAQDKILEAFPMLRH